MKSEVIIIGGGLMGLSTAVHLGLRGVKATVLEKDSPGRHASGVNAGGLRQLNRHMDEIPLTIAAAEIWKNIRSLVDRDCDVEFNGQLRVAETQEELNTLQKRVGALQAKGYSHERIIDKDTLYRLVPQLIAGCVGALYNPDDGSARPFHATSAFRYKASALGAKIHSKVEVQSIDKITGGWQLNTNQGTYTAVNIVNCAGAWANKIACAFDESVPLTPKAPMLMVTERLPPFLKPVVGAVGHKLSFKQMQNGTVIIGGAHLAHLDMQQQKTEINFAKLKTSAQTVSTFFPHMANVRIVRAWAGIEAFMPDNIPVISASSKADGVFHAFGFSAHGFQLSPIVGRIISQLILDGQTELPIKPFDIRRFQSG
ncbi:FAD-binding oxidoreductase [Paraglaciecola sp. MB-3u-78]|jgi:sarcosine oxidase subunit beta|uniref:NAD(P)/FAD-dependent oxidoreductase n=1 Tax=Paraglaciecola sp. MB-3u-78 TaxID=2058332 RepID=UPI000C321DBC|nr:FAD-binding oxidoreductase [Paraglaciecola sp. MB-3u-78]PKG99529.1 FAD-dependent oxidoreductase [Paraglaciecola sp. MB-3u-78]